MKLFKVNPGKFEILENWGKFLTNHSAMVRKLLEQENCTREFFYAFKIGNQWYVIGHMEGKNFKKPSKHFINSQHKRILKISLKTLKLKKIYDIKAPSLIQS